MTEKTDAEIFKEVALLAIQSTWRWKTATLIIVLLLLMLGFWAVFADVQKIQLLHTNNAKLDRNLQAISAHENWQKFIAEPQHRDAILKTCTQHHAPRPTWYEDIPVEGPKPTPKK